MNERPEHKINDFLSLAKLHLSIPFFSLIIIIDFRQKIHEAKIIFINYASDVSHAIYSTLQDDENFSFFSHGEREKSPSLNHYHYSISFNTNVTFFMLCFSPSRVMTREWILSRWCANDMTWWCVMHRSFRDVWLILIKWKILF